MSASICAARARPTRARSGARGTACETPTRAHLRRTCAALALACLAATAHADDLLGIYRQAVASDPVLASARANWSATQEVVPQARANLLPLVSLGGSATY